MCKIFTYLFIVHRSKACLPITATEIFCKTHSKIIKYIVLTILAAGNILIYDCLTLSITSQVDSVYNICFCVLNCRLFGVLHCCMLFELPEGTCFGYPHLSGGVYHCVWTGEQVQGWQHKKVPQACTKMFQIQCQMDKMVGVTL